MDSYILLLPFWNKFMNAFGSRNWRRSVKYLTAGQIAALTCLIQPAAGQIAASNFLI